MEIMNKYNVVEKVENWWESNSVSEYSRLSISKSVKGDVTLRFGYWLPVNLSDLQEAVGEGYKVSGHDISDGDKCEAVFYKLKKL